MYALKCIAIYQKTVKKNILKPHFIFAHAIVAFYCKQFFITASSITHVKGVQTIKQISLHALGQFAPLLCFLILASCFIETKSWYSRICLTRIV